MSYNIWLEADLGGPKLIALEFLVWKYTSNCSPMWREAGADLQAFHGRPAGECAPILADALTVLRDDPVRFTTLNPSNGWGSYESLVPELERLLDAFRQAPRAIVCVWS